MWTLAKQIVFFAGLLALGMIAAADSGDISSQLSLKDKILGQVKVLELESAPVWEWAPGLP